jgi:hypothetical protein
MKAGEKHRKRADQANLHFIGCSAVFVVLVDENALSQTKGAVLCAIVRLKRHFY